MRPTTPDGIPRTTERPWLKWMRALVHFGVVLGGAIGLQQIAAPTSATALSDSPAPANASLAHDSARLPLAERSDDDSDALESSSGKPAVISRGLAPRARRATFGRSRSIQRFESASPAHAYEARAPPRPV